MKLKKIILLAISLLLLCALLFIIIFYKQKHIMISVNDKYISEKIITQMAKDCQTQTSQYFLQKYNANLNDNSFWIKSFENEYPYIKLAENTIERIVERNVIYEIAFEKGYITDTSFEDVYNRWEKENNTRKQKKETGQIVYGPTNFSFSQFVSYEIDMLKFTFLDDERNIENHITEKEREEYYKSRESQWSYPLEQIISNVDFELKKARYDNLIKEHIKATKVAYNKSKLYNFIKQLVKH